MARYRKIDSRIWNDEKFRELSDDGKLLFLMLLTHPHMTALGGMRMTIAGLAEEIGWFKERLSEGFLEISRKGMAKHESGACLLWLPNFLRYNPPESPNVVKAWVSAADLLPECNLKLLIIKQAKFFVEELTEPFRKAFESLGEGFGKGMPNPEPEPEPEPDKKREIVPDDLDVKVQQIFFEYPGNSHLPRTAVIPHASEEVIAQRIIDDGFDAVLAGTRNYRDAVAKWPPMERKFIRKVVDFYSAGDRDYLKDPIIWDKSTEGNGNAANKVNRAEQRQEQNLNAISSAVERRRARRAASGPDGEDAGTEKVSIAH